MQITLSMCALYASIAQFGLQEHSCHNIYYCDNWKLVLDTLGAIACALNRFLFACILSRLSLKASPNTINPQNIRISNLMSARYLKFKTRPIFLQGFNVLHKTTPKGNRYVMSFLILLVHSLALSTSSKLQTFPTHTNFYSCLTRLYIKLDSISTVQFGRLIVLYAQRKICFSSYHYKLFTAVKL